MGEVEFSGIGETWVLFRWMLDQGRGGDDLAKYRGPEWVTRVEKQLDLRDSQVCLRPRQLILFPVVFVDNGVRVGTMNRFGLNEASIVIVRRLRIAV